MFKVLIVEDEELLANNLEITLKEIDPEIRILAKLDTVTKTVK
jgi:hypothetical protein